MKISASQVLQQAIQSHRNGDFDKAFLLYKSIIKVKANHPDANHNLGILLCDQDRIKDATQYFHTAVTTRPDVKQFWVSYISNLFKNGFYDETFKQLRNAAEFGIKDDRLLELQDNLSKATGNSEVISQNACNQSLKSNDIPQDLLNKLIKNIGQINIEDTINLIEQLEIDYPRSSKLLNIKGAAFSQAKCYERAKSAFRRALSIAPNSPELHNNLGSTMKSLGHLEDAISHFEKAISLKPAFPEAINNLGTALKQKGDYIKSIEKYKLAIALRPKFSEAYNNLGNAYREIREIELSIKALKDAIKINPHYLDALNNLSISLHELGDIDAAIKCSLKAISINPNYAKAHNNLGNAYNSLGEFTLAKQSYETALKLDPHYAKAHRHLSNFIKYTSGHDHHLQMLNLLNSGKLSQKDLCELYFGLAKSFEDIGDYDSAFNHYSLGNTLRKELINYHLDKDRQKFSNLLEIPNKLAKFNFSSANSRTPKPIFVLGMPRSGTTLIETIISSHDNVTAFGELEYLTKVCSPYLNPKQVFNAEVISKIRNAYFQEIEKRDFSTEYFVDKMPHNFRYIPFIVKAMPEAVIIHVRRDPRAVCWSSFKHYFPANGLGYTSDLVDLVEYYKMYANLMYCYNSFYENRIIECSYDDLTLYQERETRNLINRIGLNWDDRCLHPENNKGPVKTASSQQVRSKIYSRSSEAWMKYDSKLKNIFKLLDV